VLGAGTGAAEAARKRLVLLDFKGPKAAKIQRGVVKLLKPSATVASSKAFLRAAREVEGYAPDATGVSKVAAKLKVHGVLTGKVQKRGSRYKLTVQLLEGRSGEMVGEGIVVPLKRGRLDSSARRKLARELRAQVAELPEPGAEELGPVAAAPGQTPPTPAPAEVVAAKPAEPPAAAARPAPVPTRRKPARRPRGRRVASAEVGGAATSAGPASEGADGAITREARQPTGDPRERAIDLVAGATFSARQLSFDFADGLAGEDQPQGYDGVLVFGATADAELYPVALASGRTGGFARNVGLTAVIDKVLLIKSKLDSADGKSLPTSQTRWGAGLVYRWNLGSSATAPTLVLGARYNKLSFAIDESEADAPGDITIPDVAYTYVDPGARFRLPLGESFAVRLEGHYLFVLDTGEIQEAERYGDAGVIGFDADVGAELLLTSNVVVRAGARFAQLGLSFDGDGDPTDPNADGTQDVTSATDRYYGFYATAGVLF
jgi:hypothetical protein